MALGGARAGKTRSVQGKTMNFKQFIQGMIITAGFAALCGLGAARAAVIECEANVCKDGDVTLTSDDSFGDQKGVHADGGNQTGNTLNAHVNQDGSSVTFTSNDTIAFQGGGEATVLGPMTNLVVSFAKPWESITFTFEEGKEPGGGKQEFNFLMKVTTLDSNSIQNETTFDFNNGCVICDSEASKAGDFIVAVDGGGIIGLEFTFDPFLGQAKQFRVDQVFAGGNGIVPGTPEPSTWAMMILGFLGMAYLGYRRRHALQPRPALSFA
jgi:hypothetical protein